MSTESLSAPDHSEYVQYRALSISAVAACGLGVMSLVALLGVFWDAPSAILCIPLLGVIVGFLSLRKLKRQSAELTGSKLATVGMVLSLTSLVLGAGYSQYRFRTEVPVGYERIEFLQLEPIKSRPDLPISPVALALNGKKVFVKGFVLSDDKRMNLKSFAIVPDLGDCCFGGQPKLYKMIQTEIKSDDTVGFSFFKRAFGGTLRIDPRKKDSSGVQGGHFYLEVDYVK